MKGRVVFKLLIGGQLCKVSNDFRHLDDILSNLEFDTRFSLEPVLAVPNQNFASSSLFHNLTMRPI
jgi:hypothetical protein